MANENEGRSHTSSVMSASMLYSTKYFQREGYIVDDVSTSKKGTNLGYDLIVKKNGDLQTVEVKGTTGTGIPDAYESEFEGLDGDPKFIADLLCLVRLNKRYMLKDVVILTKEEINDINFTHVTTRRIRFSSTLKTRVKNGKLGTIVWDGKEQL